MTQKIKNTRRIAFINRTKELQFLSERIHDEPNDILFIYGPKSSGKTTLLTKFIELHLNDKHYNIKHFNLREVLIANYTDFIQAFFEVDYSKSPQEVKKRSEYSLKVFKLSKEIKQSLEKKILDPFVVMKKELQKIVKKGKRPIIIIDELQALDDIYMNGQRELLKELFNFFVAMTKESHLCHVIIASSDGYFLKRIYEDSKLAKTSKYYSVDYLNEADTHYWLNHLESESAIASFKLTDSQINLIWKYFGGSMWEISDLLGDLIPCSKNSKISDEVLMSNIQKRIDDNYGRFEHYVGFNKSKRKLLVNIYNCCSKAIYFKHRDMEPLIQHKIYDENALSHELNRLVQMNYLAFDPTKTAWQLQGNSMFYGLQQFIKSIEVENGDEICQNKGV
ncbi:MAG: ATPase [Candidatus Magnetoglobus multicellularis str. Araruama]|uniref:ATPase n=1 Tax=Candidatus Magnetoglobus multicellularis str. Araruama TaxID=890399 RepID=A0A1V1P0G2_9BACT|nr:MAG: ATPase [Candidatus Magnetoglobus multicellularis str. Araruama]